jgi:all-trans-retinol 13,14-reductase
MVINIPKYDTIVIGGGISGAVCALLRARKGEKVVVVERSATLSPTLNGFIRQGLYMDSGFHYAGSIGKDGLLRRLLNELGIAEPLNGAIHILDTIDYFRLMKPAFDFLFPQGWESLQQRLCNTFPADSEGIKSFLMNAKALSEQSRITLFQKPGINPETFFSGNHCSVKEAINRFTSNPVLDSVLSCHGILYSMSARETSLMFHSQIVGSYYESSCFIEGGGRTIVNIIEKKLRDANVTVICDKRVCRIHLDNNGAFSAVELQKGDMLAANKCICTTHPKLMLAMVPEKAFSPAYRHRIERLEETASAVVLFGRCPSSNFTGNLILAKEPNSFSDWTDMPLEERPLFISCPVKTATSTVSVICPTTIADIPGKGDTRPNGYKDWKREVAEQLIHHISSCAGDLLGDFEVLDVATPMTFRDKLCSPEGGLYGVKHRINDMPLLPRTSVKGLYLSGQAVVAPGVLGAICSSFLTERFIA